MPKTFENPVLPGFYPDPSVVCVGQDFYLVTSTFEYFPGVPIFHSRNLVNWTQLGHCLTRPAQLPLAAAPSSAGIFAPTLRFRDGTFYLITTNVSSKGHFIVTTKDPAGEWSDPLWIEDDSGGIDPSLLFDEDGKVYYTRHHGGERGVLVQAELDVTTGKLRTPLVEIWTGTGGVWPEGPHLYRIFDTYYLVIAEGGTGYGHGVTVARASRPFGPFEANPKNPILTHRHLRELPIQATGHADLVRAPDGSFWMVFLGIRPPDGRHHQLGRETFLTRVEWDADGWPLVNGGRSVPLVHDAEGLPGAVEGRRENSDRLVGERLPLHWVHVRNPRPESYSLAARAGWLRLFGSEVTLDDLGSPTFVGRRQQHLEARTTTRLEFQPAAAGDHAGLVLRANEQNHAALVVERTGGGDVVRLKTRLGAERRVVAELPVSRGQHELGVTMRTDRYEFFWKESGAVVPLGAVPAAALSSEVAGGFTGVVVGLYVTGQGAIADFDGIHYQPR